MKRVLILHTGGTLGMSSHDHRRDASRFARDEGSRRPSALQPDTYAHEILSRVPELGALATIETRILCNLDSSDVGPEEWSALADEIARARADHDGIVVIHGTDTMAYTASALSFALSGLDRPVVLTGSQRPLGEIRSDARRNLVDAVDLATRDIPEVGVCFDGRLLRGNRATKGDAWSYTAFASPNCAPLARLGLDVEVASHVRRPAARFSVDGRFDAHVAVAPVTPGMEPRLVEQLGDAGMRGVVLAAFGVGNVPVRARSVAGAVRRLVDSGITVAVVTQAHAGGVDLSLYENGVALRDAGALSGGDMGVEAAVAKLMHACAVFDEPRARGEYFVCDVAGERGDGLVHILD
jgi:L-asparaginase